MGKTIYQKLGIIQRNLNAPKGQWNNFGGFSYRSCEDILEGLKPFVEEQDVSIVLSDRIVPVEDRIYVEAHAALVDNETGDKVEVTAYAREPEVKKGMDESQITGSTSSYARKYALNGLFAIDDAKDADTDEYTEEAAIKSQAVAKQTSDPTKGDELKELVNKLAHEKKITKKKAMDIMRKHGASSYTHPAVSEKFDEIKADIEAAAAE